MKRIDMLPYGPGWTCTTLRVTGDEIDDEGEFRTEELELWHRDPVECIQELLENPAFKDVQAFAPCRVYKNEDMTNREYSEMWTADQWWQIQVRIDMDSKNVNDSFVVVNRNSYRKGQL
jgi:Plavaka transposase